MLQLYQKMAKLANYFIASSENNYHPLALTYKAFIVYGLALLLLRLVFGALPTHGAAVDSQTLMNLINQERSQRNLTVLNANQALLKAAGEKSQDMIDRGYFSHIDPDGNYIWPKIVAAGYTPYKILGENLALDFTTSEGMIEAWLNSPAHRANLLHPDFVDQGLSALFGNYQGRYTDLTTSLFGALATAVPTAPAVKSSETTPPPATQPKPAPTPKPQPAPQPEPAPAVPPAATSMPTTTAPSYLQNGQVRQEPAVPSQSEPPLVEFTAKPGGRYTAFAVSRVLFTLFGLFLLGILSADSIILYKHEAEISRAHTSYHLFGLMLIVLISILIWWW